MKQTIIILGGGILQVSLIEEAHALNYHVICSDRDPNCACRDVCDTFWNIDTFDSAEHVKRAIKLVDEHSIQIIGCIAAGVDCIETAENVNGWIRTQTSNKNGFWAGFKATAICRDKIKFRQWQKDNNFPHPMFHSAYKDEIFLVGSISVKNVIIKASDNSGGRGNTKFTGGEYNDNYNKAVRYAINNSKRDFAVVEELLIGKEYTVETIWEDGTMYPAFITDRYFRNDDKYAIEAGASHPTQLSKIMQNKVYREMRRLGESLGMTFGPLKGDLLITKENKIYILEATTRYSGGWDCQMLVPLATGKNVLKAAIQCNVYGKFDKSLLKAKWDKYSMIGSPFPKEGIIKEISIPHDYRFAVEPGQTEPWMTNNYFLNAKVGDEVKYRDSTDRVAFLIVSRETRTETIRAMKEGLENIKIEVE